MDSTKKPLVAQHSDGGKLIFPNAQIRLEFFAKLGVLSWDATLESDCLPYIARWLFQEAVKEAGV